MTIDDSYLGELRDVISAFVAATCGESVVRAGVDAGTGADRALWNAFCTRTGMQSIGVPTAHGGDGAGITELCIVLEEVAKALAPLPFLSTSVLVPAVLDAASDEQASQRYLPGIADGTTTAAIAAVETPPRWEPSTWTTSASGSGDQWQLSGIKSLVIDGASADLLLVFAHAPQGLSLFCVTADAPGVTRDATPSLDLTRPLSTISFADSPARLIGSPGEGEAVLGHLLTTLRIALAAEALGGAQRCLDLSVDYAKTRVQFGRPIGSFQAIKHACADMFIELSAARAAVSEAVLAHGEKRDDAAALAAVAFVESARVYASVAEETIHVHGGIGFTWEHSAHLYYRRAKSAQLFLGGPTSDYQAVLTALGV